uniref:Ribonuclease VapC n=1 Tax=Archaeoglobus fulgidus TaxID=2234 RepID=A0A7J3M174_ARCFL
MESCDQQKSWREMEVNRFRSNCVVFDTNALIYAVKNKVDLSEFKIVLPKVVIDELKSLEKRLSGEDKIAVRVALKIVEKAEIVESESGDVGILEVARKMRSPIVTNDKELRKKAEKLGIPTAYVKLGKIVVNL